MNGLPLRVASCEWPGLFRLDDDARVTRNALRAT